MLFRSAVDYDDANDVPDTKLYRSTCKAFSAHGMDKKCLIALCIGNKLGSHDEFTNLPMFKKFKRRELPIPTNAELKIEAIRGIHFHQ